MKLVSDIRSDFLSYFARQGHEVVPSASLIPQNDPTLLFTNSGMVPFKNLFTGTETRPYKRATSAQKSVRAGGKHNDLENVGYTARHHTFFEMLGNFSFGDYFKDDAIPFAWELITKTFGLPKDKLLVTVYHDDDVAANIWKKVAGLSDDRIIRIATSDNFWMMGDTGPCGPCSEIFYDHGDHIYGGPPGSADEDGDRFIEIWNLVFMQYEQLANGERIDLPKPSIDTGMGLERVAAILQGVHSNYEIDLFKTLIETSADLTGVAPYGEFAASHRVIADHLRSSAFLIADGILPGNEGRSYVLRRIMRRGMRHAHILGAKEPLMYRLFPTLLALMGEAYPELKRAEALIVDTLRLEETRFKTTLERGLKILEDETTSLTAGQKLSGAVAFKLYDTYGFPIDLTQDALRAKNIGVDTEGFEENMARQRAEARKNWSGSGDTGTEKIWFELLDKHAPTEFLGYDKESAGAQVQAIYANGAVIDKADAGAEVMILCNQTPFYAESGGQVGDTGVLETETGTKVEITDTIKRVGKLFLHVGKVTQGSLKTGDGVTLTVDHARRSNIRTHHSVTHLLHEALRQVLGDHIAQKGSLQTSDRTRFDVSHQQALSTEQIRAVEDMVNAEIRANTEVITRVLPLEDAMESGARALFGEKYEGEVRVVSMGSTPAGQNHPFSVELCGGTHVKRTGDIGLFHILSDSAVSSGVRRIEAIAGATALDYFRDQETRVQDASQLLKASPVDLVARVAALAEERKKLDNEVATLRRQLASSGGASQSGPDIKEIAGIQFTSRILSDLPAKDLKPLADDLKAKLGSGVVALISTDGGKASIVVGVTSDLTSKVSAVDLVKVGAAALGGAGGGGRPDMAQAGGPNPDAANDAVKAIEAALA